jgi:protein-L-isoaspartate(D-aspartate) O-methyltransferase
MNRIQLVRLRYAQMLAAGASADSADLERAFAAVPREQFVGEPPWLVESSFGFIRSDTPDLLYQDVLVALSVERGINNGQPSLHAQCLAALDVATGETAVHVGAGTGYYTAILAQLVGPAGAVQAYEIEGDLAALAARNLAAWPNVRVHAESACDRELPVADVIYVNAGASHPPASWLDALAPGARLMFPLTPDDGVGAMLLVTHLGAQRYRARFTTSVAFIACRGARRQPDAAAVAAAFRQRSRSKVRSLWRNRRPDDTAWCVGTDWWLSTAEIGPGSCEAG